ncbi:MAG: DEAD/DEAH box helicase [Lentisphaeria bacterium]|nr:DEAD/DEAH box helicase [Lentisphaeria bacterium]
MILNTFDDDGEIAFNIDEFSIDYQLTPEKSVDLSEACREFFLPGGILAAASADKGFICEERPQQLVMALTIADALKNRKNACIEAPTGVGKSFAYLLPLIHHALNSRQPVLISTETINLQHQLIEKDLPFLKELTGLDFRVALAKGRGNYLCRRRLAMLSGEQRDMLLPIPAMILETEKLLDDLNNGRDENYLNGVRDNSRIWHMVCSESGNCAGSKCEFFRNCFYYRARRKWDEADIVVANHALFLTDLAIRQEKGNGGTLLPDYGAVMIDEAHTLENNAAAHLGIHFSRPALLGLLNRLYNPERAKGLLMRPGSNMLEMRSLAQQCRGEVYAFFNPYSELLTQNNTSSLRLNERVPDTYPELLLEILRRLASGMDNEVENIEEESWKTEFISSAERCRSFADSIQSFTQRLLDGAVYYVEKESENISCYASPLNVAELLEKILFGAEIPVMLCSATMTVAGKFDYFLSRTGFSGGQVTALDSPFSPDQAKLLVNPDMPEPSSPDYLPLLAENIGRLLEDNQGSAFVLFTSYQSMKYCYQALEEKLTVKGFPLLVQGEGLNRAEMLKKFQASENSILFGTDSFWTGVDVPGDKLTMVIITRLPFASIGTPLISARMERIEASGKSSFSCYSLPEAVLKFRQGAGRLIRRRSDHGRIVVLDSRIVKKYYGREFVNSLPYKMEYL